MCVLESPYAVSIEISPVLRLRIVMVPRMTPVCSAMSRSTG